MKTLMHPSEYQAADECYGMFRDRFDTRDIAAARQITEAEASKLVWIGRCRAKRLAAECIDHLGRHRTFEPKPLKLIA